MAAVFSPINLPSTNATSIATTTEMSTNFENAANSVNNSTTTTTTTAATSTAMESTVCSVAGDERTEAHDVAKDSRKQFHQYMKISHGFTTCNAEDYEENNTSNDNNNTMVDNTIKMEDDGNAISKDKINSTTDNNAAISKSVQKFPKAKDLKSSLTPRQQQQQQQQITKRYGSKEFQKPLQLQSSYSAPNVVTPTTNPSSCYKSTTKNRNNTNGNPAAAASTATIS